MKAIVSETNIRIVPEDANEEFALRQWNFRHDRDGEGFILEVREDPEADFGHRYRFCEQGVGWVVASGDWKIQTCQFCSFRMDNHCRRLAPPYPVVGDQTKINKGDEAIAYSPACLNYHDERGTVL
jgi:hypothetical protein